MQIYQKLPAQSIFHNHPEVSVVMSVYNGGKYLDAAIGSILKQTFQNFEFIIINDGSDDNTQDIIQKHSNNDSRIVIINKKKTGLADSLNIGVLKSRGNFIARFDADDICLPERIKKQLEFLSYNPTVHILGGAAVSIDGHGRLGKLIRRPETHKEMVKRIWTETPFIHPTIMIRRNVWMKTGGYDTSFTKAQDREFWLRCHRLFRFHNLQEPLIYYRIDSNRAISWRSAYDSGRAVWRNIRREKKPLHYNWYVMRPMVATLMTAIRLRKA